MKAMTVVYEIGDSVPAENLKALMKAAPPPGVEIAYMAMNNIVEQRDQLGARIAELEAERKQIALTINPDAMEEPQDGDALLWAQMTMKELGEYSKAIGMQAKRISELEAQLAREQERVELKNCDLDDCVKKIAQLEAQQRAGVSDIGSTIVNDACWTFIEKMPHELPGPIFNDLKPALYAALSDYHAAVMAAPAPKAQQRAGVSEGCLLVPAEVIRDVLDYVGEVCRLDHHGHCQEHGLQDADDCFGKKLRDLLAAAPAPEAKEQCKRCLTLCTACPDHEGGKLTLSIESAPQPAEVGADERAKFEYWASDEGESPKAVEREGHGYRLQQTQTYWMAWQARAQLSEAGADEREALSVAVGKVLFNAMNYPKAVQAKMLGQDFSPLREKVVDAVLQARAQLPCSHGGVCEQVANDNAALNAENAELRAQLTEGAAIRTKAELYDEVWQKARDMGYSNVTMALEALTEGVEPFGYYVKDSVGGHFSCNSDRLAALPRGSTPLYRREALTAAAAGERKELSDDAILKTWKDWWGDGTRAHNAHPKTVLAHARALIAATQPAQEQPE